MQKIIILLPFLLLFYQLSSQQVTLYGIAPSYKNQNIRLYTLSDFISQQENDFVSLKIDNNGKFETTVSVPETRLIVCHLGIFKSIFYVEPGKNLWLNFPKKIDKSLGDSLNPYFEETEFVMGINDTTLTDLNYSIKLFDDEFDEYLSKKFFDIYRKAYKSDVDSFISITEENYKASGNKYFNDYRYYRYAYLKNIAYMRDFRYVTKEFYMGKPALYNNKAYTDLFNNLYYNFLNIYSTGVDGKDVLNSIVLSKSIHSLKQALRKYMFLQDDTIMELAILKGIHDAFYYPVSGEYKNLPKPQLFQVLDSVRLTTRIPQHKLIAQNIREKILRLLPGTKAPELILNNSKGKPQNINETDGKYTYLFFIHTKSLACREELVLINELYKKYKKDINFIAVSLDNNFNDAKSYFEDKGYKWPLLDGSNNTSIYRDFKIAVFPTYLLISKDNRLVLSPAPSPKENFEAIFNQNYKSKDPQPPKEYEELFKDPTLQK